MAAAAASAKDVWRELKATSAALRAATGQKDRQRAVHELQAFLSDDARRQLVRKWRAWGLLLSNLLHAVRCDAQPFLNGGSAAAGRKKKAPKNGPKAPTITYWVYLRNEFASLHALAEPLLHMDANGRECLRQLFDFAVAVIGRESGGNEDARVAVQLEEEAWRTIKAIVPFRVYCAVVDPTHLQDVLELALASLEHGNTVGLASSAVLRAEIVQYILKNCPFDLHELLPRLLEFFGEWFGKVGVGSGLVSLTSVEDVALKLLEAVVGLMRTYATSIGLPVMQHGVSILHYIQRVWKSTKFRPRVHQTEYIVQFLALFAGNAPEIIISSSIVPVQRDPMLAPKMVQEICIGGVVRINPRLLLKTLKALLVMLLNPKEVQSLLLNAKLARGSMITTGGTNVSVLIDLEYPIASYLRCTADVIYHHDRLVAALVEQSSVISNSASAATVGSKRERPVNDTLAWESLLENICTEPVDGGDPSAAMSSPPSSSGVFTTTVPLVKSQATQARDATHRPATQKQHVSWLLIVLAVLSRNGEHYVANRIGDVMTVMDQLIQLLESKAIDQRQYVALTILVQLTHLAVRHSDACRENLEDLWQKLWRCLLRPDLPYAHATESAVVGRDSSGDVVLHLLANCVSFDLVSPGLVAETQARVWSLPVFRSSRTALVSASRSASSTATSSNASITPVRLLSALLRCVELQEGITEEFGGELLSQTLSVTDEAPLAPRTLRASLLSTLFVFLEVHMLHEAPSNELSDGSSVSAVAYASAVLAFLQSSQVWDGKYFGDGMVSKLLRILSRSNEETGLSDTSSELDGFGVHFPFHEDGLTKLYESDPHSHGPHRFAAVIQEYLEDASFQSSFHIGKASAATQDRFEHLKLPADLLAPLFHQEYRSFDFDMKKLHRTLHESPSISKETQMTMHKDVTRHFARILQDIATKLSSLGADHPRVTMRTIAGAMNVSPGMLIVLI